MMKLSLFSTLIAVATWPLAQSAELCRSTCQSALSYVVFEGNNTKPQCTNPLYITSYRACLGQYCPQDARAAYTALGTACKSTFADSAITNITVDLNGLPKITAKDLYKKTPIRHVVALDSTLYTLSSRTITSAVVQDRLNIRYGHAMYGFWAVALLISSFSNLLKHILPKIDTTPAGRMLNKRWIIVLSSWFKRHLLIPTFLGKRTASSAGWYTIPARLQSCTIIAFVAVNIALCVSGYEVFSGNLKRPSIPGQTTRLIGRRTGVVIMANLPLMWTFAMRNNILSWASGWSFATFNTFHRWIARVVMAELIAHAIAYSLSEYYSGGLKKYDAQWPQEYWWWGVVSMIAGSIATASAAYPVRQRFYDAFLLGHIMLATMFLIGTWFHIKKQDNEFDMYFWPCVAVWALDRALRLGRILMLNRSFGRANIAYDRASDMIHLDVQTRSVISPQAGTYYYVYLLHGTKFWESHPFTLSSWEATTGEQGGGGHTLKFLIRPLKGFTGRLKDLAVQNVHAENGSKELPQRFVSALVEGPYGHANGVSSYSSALFIVGGSGITVAISHLRSLNDTFNKHQHIATRTVRVVWAVRRLELASDLLQNNILPWLVESSLASRVDVTFDIFVTEPIAKGALSPVEKEPLPGSGTSDENSRYLKGAKATIELTSVKDCSDEPSERNTAFVQIHAGRPPLRDICLNYTDRFASQGGRVAIVCCGPAAMTDDVRAQAIEAISTGVDNMDFFPESFSW